MIKEIMYWLILVLLWTAFYCTPRDYTFTLILESWIAFGYSVILLYNDRIIRFLIAFGLFTTISGLLWMGSA